MATRRSGAKSERAEQPESLSEIAVRLGRAELDLVVLSAPSGFGKTRLATQLATQHTQSASCDARAGRVDVLARALISALAVEDPSRANHLTQLCTMQAERDTKTWEELARDLWTESPSCPTTFVFDNAEGAIANDDCAAFLSTLFATRPSTRRIVICSRVPVPRAITRHVLPHRLKRVSPHEFALQLEDVAALLRFQNLPDAAAVDIMQISRGWPLAVLLLLRLLREHRDLQEIARLGASDYDELFEHLADEYLHSLAPWELTVLIGSVAIPATSADELAAILRVPVGDSATFISDCPFVSTDIEGRIQPHPILRATIMRRFAAKQAELLSTGIATAAKRCDFVRAAELALAADQPQRAIALLNELPLESSLKRVVALARVINAFDVGVIVSNPSLWLSTIQCRRFSLPLDDYVSESRRIYYCLAPGTDGRLRANIAAQYASALGQAGRIRDSMTVIREAIENADDDLTKQFLGQHLAVWFAKIGQFKRARREFLAIPSASDDGRLRLRFLDELEATRALLAGEYERGMTLLDEARDRARENGLLSSYAIILGNIAIESFLAGDQKRYESAIAELRSIIPSGLEEGFQFLVAAAAGDVTASPTGYEGIGVRIAGFVLLAAKTGAHQLDAARRAVELANRNEDPFPRLVARIALAELSPSDRPEILASLPSIAAETDIEELHASVAAYVAGESAIGYLEPFVKQLRVATGFQTLFRIELTSSEVMRDSEPVTLSTREKAVLTFLAIRARPVHRDTICDAIWPDLEADAAANNLKVVIHRLRKKLDDRCVIFLDTGYALGPHVVVDLRESEAFVARATYAPKLDSSQRAQIRQLVDRLKKRTPGEMMQWSWYVSLDHRLSELCRSCLLALGRDAFERHHYIASTEFANELLAIDAGDEEASELIVDSFVAQGDVGAALRYIRRLEKAAREDNDALTAGRVRARYLDLLTFSTRP